MRIYITAFMLATSLGLVSCGGGNDVASSGASAVSAAAPASNVSPASAPATTTPITEPKVNGQVDERTGVAPVVARANLGHKYCVTCSSCHVPMDMNLSFCPPCTP